MPRTHLCHEEKGQVTVEHFLGCVKSAVLILSNKSPLDDKALFFGLSRIKTIDSRYHSQLPDPFPQELEGAVGHKTTSVINGTHL